MVVNCTDPSPSVRLPWYVPFEAESNIYLCVLVHKVTWVTNVGLGWIIWLQWKKVKVFLNSEQEWRRKKRFYGIATGKNNIRTERQGKTKVLRCYHLKYLSKVLTGINWYINCIKTLSAYLCQSYKNKTLTYH
jgi:hypothetical protein